MADLSHVPQASQIHQMFGSQGAAPQLPEITPVDVPERPRPEFDESKVQSLSQQHAAPGIRTLREAYQTAAARLPSNPQSRLTLKDALKGYGTGLESVMGGARKTARAEYGQQFAAEEKAVSQEYAAQVAMLQSQAQAQAQAQFQQFQMSYADYLKSDQSQGGGHYVPGGGYGGAEWVEPYTIY